MCWKCVCVCVCSEVSLFSFPRCDGLEVWLRERDVCCVFATVEARWEEMKGDEKWGRDVACVI